MKVIKVLFVDDGPTTYLPVPELAEHGIKLDIIPERLWNPNSYHASQEICDAIDDLTTRQMVDIVVVGNNRSTGVAKAAAIAESMKEKTIVVWNAYVPGDETPYAVLGLRHFCSRRDLRRMFPAVLGLTMA